MNIIDLIETKKKKEKLTQEQIEYFISAYLKDEIADYQASALLMAFNINGLDNDEILYLTQSFLNYSKTMVFEKLNNNPIIDKHSSGGVGDKITIILTPILTALGFNVPKISGRALGYTGGTIDKLDSLKVKTDLTFEQANTIYRKNHCVVFQQTNDYVPADKKIYALRDVTATVDTMGLIVASILSKKFIINSDYIFIDLKVGDGALVSTIEQAEELSKKMLYVAKKLNRNLTISLTDMNQPLGWTIGNYLEICESIDFLKGINQAKDLKQLLYEIVNEILIVTQKSSSKQQSFALIDEVINSQVAYKHFINWLIDQNANQSLIDNYSKLRDKYQLKIIAHNDGYLNIKSAKKLGMIAIDLGAGRLNKQTQIDSLAGISFYNKTNDYLKKGDLIAILYSNQPISKEIENSFCDNLEINSKQKDLNNIIIKTIV